MRQEGMIKKDGVVEDMPARDKVAALAAVGGDENLAQELFATLLQGIPADLEHLTRSLQNEDWNSLAEAAHRMRGATSYCGVPALDMALLDLERAAKTGDAGQILFAVRQVDREAKRLNGETLG